MSAYKTISIYFDESEAWRTQSAWQNVLENTLDAMGLTAIFGKEARTTVEEKELTQIENALATQRAELMSRCEDLSRSYSDGKLQERKGFYTSQSTFYETKSDLEKAREVPFLLYDIARGEDLYKKKSEEVHAGEEVKNELILSAERKEKISQMLCDYGVTIDQTTADEFPWDWLGVDYDLGPARENIFLDVVWSDFVDQNPARTRDGLDKQSEEKSNKPEPAQ